MRFSAVFTLATLFVLSACLNHGDPPADHQPATDPAPAPTAPDVAVMDSLRTEIRDRVDARASHVGACRTIPFGAKPCGGPWTYLVFSTERTDSIALTRLVDEYNALEAHLNQEQGRLSDCALVVLPVIELRDGQCMATR